MYLLLGIFSCNMNLTDLITKQSKSRPDSIAVYYDEGSISYKELEYLIWRVSNDLYENGVKRGDVISLLFDDELMLLISMLATARLGATVFSLPISTPMLLCDEMLKKVKAVFIVTNIKISKIGLKKITINRKLLYVDSGYFNKNIKDNNPTAPWLIISGSGTTGNSKLIPVTHAQFMSRIKVYDDIFEISEYDRITSLINLDFATPKHQLLHALFNGAAIVFFTKPFLNKIERIIEQKVTVVYSVIVHLEQMINSLPSNSKTVLESLKVLVTSGSTVTEHLRKKVWDKLTNNLCVAYGTNECWLISQVKQQSLYNTMKSVGHPCSGVNIEIVDNNGNKLDIGEVGYVRIKSHGMIESYLNDKESTKQAFKGGWFYPGDLGKFSKNGELLYWGRADHMMIMDGINIYPAEIESVMTQHPSVIDAAVMPIKHHAHQDVPVCAVVIDKSHNKKELMDFAYQRLGSSGPREMFILNEIPRNEQGKLIRIELHEIISKKLMLKQKQSRQTVLVMFSGGVDSTFMLYHYLKNTDFKIHVHHISLRYPSEPRWKEEDISSRKIVEFCRNIRPFDYSESRVDVGFYKYVGRDSDTQLLMASKVAPNIKGKVSIALGWLYSDYQDDILNGRATGRITEKLWEALCDSMDKNLGENVDREILFPLIDMKISKKEILKAIPQELLILTWSCRRPVKDNKNISRPCGKCHPCSDIKMALA